MTITGKVVDSQTGKGLAGAMVYVLDSTGAKQPISASTNLDGTFTLFTSLSDGTLQASFVGYSSTPIPLAANVTIPLNSSNGQNAGYSTQLFAPNSTSSIILKTSLIVAGVVVIYFIVKAVKKERQMGIKLA